MTPDSVERIVAEMRDEGSIPTISHAHSRTLQKLDEWADRLSAQSTINPNPIDSKSIVDARRATRCVTHHYACDCREWGHACAIAALEARAEAAEAALREESARLDYIERTFSGMTNRERYLPVTMIWGKGCNGRTLREACDKYMKRDAAIGGTGDA